MEPSSRSRTMASVDNRGAKTIGTNANRPGTRKFMLRSSGLNHTRASATTPGEAMTPVLWASRRSYLPVAASSSSMAPCAWGGDEPSTSYLYLGGCASLQGSLEVRRDNHADIDLASVEPVAELVRATCVVGDPQVSGGCQTGHVIAAGGTLVDVEDAQANRLGVHVQAVAENHQQDDGQRQRQRKRHGVAPQLAELLADDRA